MSIGKKIKRLRKEKNLTQEQLAEYLGVSAQAVSGWECDKFTPDIYQLPKLASVFEVSTDEILEVDMVNKHINIDAFIRSVKAKYIQEARWQEAVEALRDGLKKYPNSHIIMLEISNAIVCFNSKNDINDYEEVFLLCNKILSQSTDSVLRYRALYLLALAYSYAGDTENMRKTVCQMPSASYTRESFMVWKHLDAEGADKNKKYLSFLLSEALEVIEALSACVDVFSDNQRMEMAKQEILLMESMFPDGDFQAYAQFGCNACERIAEFYHQKGDREQFFCWLDRHCDFAIYMDSYNSEEVHTSALFCGVLFDNCIKDEETSRIRQSIIKWSDDKYHDVKEDVRFKNAIQRLLSLN